MRQRGGSAVYIFQTYGFASIRKSVVGTVTKLWAGRYTVRMPTDVGDISLLQDVKNVSGAHPASFPKG